MPVYRVKCEKCGDVSEIFRRMSEYDDLPTCVCGGKTERMICAPAIHPDISPYISPGTGKLIDSRVKQAEDLRVSNSILKEPGLDKDIERNRKYVAEKSFSPIEAGIDNIVRDCVNAGKLESL